MALDETRTESESTPGIHDQEMGAEERNQILDRLGMIMAETRSEAMEARKRTGIETEWCEDEEHYEGIDDSNRHEFEATYHTKPWGRKAIAKPEDRPTGSKVFPNITAPYVDAGAARAADILLPTDDINWAYQPTPIPDQIHIAQGHIPPHLENQLDRAFPKPEIKDEEFPDGSAPRRRAEGMKVRNKKFQESQDVVDEARDKFEIAKRAAEKAQTRVRDWHVECQYHAHVRQQIEDAARIGTGVIKGPFPLKKTRLALVDGKAVTQTVHQPITLRVDVWDCFPDLSCGERIHDGSYHWERGEITRRELESKKGGEGNTKYLDDQIDLCLREGPYQAISEFENSSDNRMAGLTPEERKNTYEIWYGYCQIEAEQIRAAGIDVEDDTKTHDVHVSLVNNHVIKVAENLLETGDFPYDYMPWQRRKGLPFGISLARRMRTPQRMCTAATRLMMDNAGLAGRPSMVYKHGTITPGGAPGTRMTIGGGQIYIANGQDADLQHLDKMIFFLKIPMLQAEIERIIMLSLRLAEDVTGIPMIMQGQMTHRTPDTLGGMKMLNDNASTILRRIARLFDDLVTEPHLTRYYKYLLQWGEHEDEKGEFIIDARGSSALIEREAQGQVLMQLMGASRDPAYGMDPEKITKQVLKSQRIDPDTVMFDDEEKRKLMEQMKQSAEGGGEATQVAQIRGDFDLQKTGMLIEDKNAQREFEIAIEAMEQQYNEQKREFDMAMKALEQDLDEGRLQMQDRHHLDNLKKAFAELDIKGKLQLAMQQMGGGPQLMKPPAEPPGRASPGEAYQK